MNLVILQGNLVKDPEVRYTQSGAAVTSFSMATNEKTKDGKTVPEYHRIVVFGKTAEACGKYLKKGNPTLITGKIRTRSYQDKQSVTKYITEVLADKVNFLGAKESEKIASLPIDPTMEMYDDVL